MPFKPMLAPREEPASFPDYWKLLRYPLEVSPKLDGIRGAARQPYVVSRTLKPLPSFQVQEEFGHLPPLDGEITVGAPTEPDVYNKTQSHVMSFDKIADDLRYYVFDYTEDSWKTRPFYERLGKAAEIVKALKRPDIILVEHQSVESYEELLAYEEVQLALGFEGVMMRNPIGEYKWGRATFLQELIYKLKRSTDDEGVVIGFEEQYTNTNKQERNELGLAKRSSSKEGLVRANTLGAFIVLWRGMELTVGCGFFSHLQRKHIWENRQSYLGDLLKFRYFGYGNKDMPRFPRALGWRDKMDV